MEEFEHPSGTTNDWDLIRPMLDQVMDDLNDEDREALLLRFFKDRDFRSIGASLGISDDAAQKRIRAHIVRERRAKSGTRPHDEEGSRTLCRRNPLE
jgi:DNA-directed RNA polymerase specialized sigma subunit